MLRNSQVDSLDWPTFIVDEDLKDVHPQRTCEVFMMIENSSISTPLMEQFEEGYKLDAGNRIKCISFERIIRRTSSLAMENDDLLASIYYKQASFEVKERNLDCEFVAKLIKFEIVYTILEDVALRQKLIKECQRIENINLQYSAVPADAAKGAKGAKDAKGKGKGGAKKADAKKAGKGGSKKETAKNEEKCDPNTGVTSRFDVDDRLRILEDVSVEPCKLLIVLTGFYDFLLVEELYNIGTPVNCVIKIISYDEQIGATDEWQQKLESEENRKSLTDAIHIEAFWKNFLLEYQQKVGLKIFEQLFYTFFLHKNDHKNPHTDIMVFEKLGEIAIEAMDTRDFYQYYLSEMDVRNVQLPEEESDTDYFQTYHNLLQLFPYDCINVSLIMDCMVKQITDPDAFDISLVSPPSEIKFQGGVRHQLLQILKMRLKKKSQSTAKIDATLGDDGFMVYDNDDIEIMAKTYKKFKELLFDINVDQLAVCMPALLWERLASEKKEETLKDERAMADLRIKRGIKEQDMESEIFALLLHSIPCQSTTQELFEKVLNLQSDFPLFHHFSSDDDVGKSSKNIGAIKWYENLHGPVMLQELLRAQLLYECADYKYCDFNDCILIRYHNVIGTSGLHNKSWETHLETPVCIQDFCKFIIYRNPTLITKLQHEYYAIFERKEMERENEERRIQQERYPDLIITDSDFIQTGSYKDTLLHLKTAPVTTNVNVSSSSKKSPSSKVSLTKPRKTLSTNTLPEKEYLFTGYDFETNRLFEMSGSKTVYQSLDGVKVRVLRTNYIDKSDFSINVQFRRFVFVMHRMQQPHRPIFHFLMNDGTIIALAKLPAIAKATQRPKAKMMRKRKGGSEQEEEEQSRTYETLMESSPAPKTTKPFTETVIDEENLRDKDTIITQIKTAIEENKPIFKVYNKPESNKYISRTKSNVEIGLGSTVKRIFNKKEFVVDPPPEFPEFIPNTSANDLNYHFKASLPSGLMISTWSTKNSEPYVIKQEYIAKTAALKAIADEISRSFLRNGFVAITRRNGEIHMLGVNGQIAYCDLPCLNYEYVKTEETKLCCYDLNRFHNVLLRTVDQEKKEAGNVLEEQYQPSYRTYKHYHKMNVDGMTKKSLLKTMSSYIKSCSLINSEGVQFNIATTGVSVENNKYPKVMEHDMRFNEIFFSRDDGIKTLLQETGVLETEFPDGTRITSWFVISPQLRIFRDAAERNEHPNLDEGWVFVQLYFKYEHPHYASVTYSSVTDNYEINLPNGAEIRSCTKGNCTIMFDDASISTIDERSITLETVACIKCLGKTKTIINIAPLFIDANPIPSDTWLLDFWDTHFNEFRVDYGGNCTQNERSGEVPCLKHVNHGSQAYFALRRNLSGIKFLDIYEFCRRLIEAESNPGTQVHDFDETILEKIPRMELWTYQFRPHQMRFSMYYNRPALSLTNVERQRTPFKPCYTTRCIIKNLPEISKVQELYKALFKYFRLHTFSNAEFALYLHEVIENCRRVNRWHAELMRQVQREREMEKPLPYLKRLELKRNAVKLLWWRILHEKPPNYFKSKYSREYHQKHIPREDINNLLGGEDASVRELPEYKKNKETATPRLTVDAMYESMFDPKLMQIVPYSYYNKTLVVSGYRFSQEKPFPRPTLSELKHIPTILQFADDFLPDQNDPLNYQSVETVVSTEAHGSRTEHIVANKARRDSGGSGSVVLSFNPTHRRSDDNPINEISLELVFENQTAERTASRVGSFAENPNGPSRDGSPSASGNVEVTSMLSEDSNKPRPGNTSAASIGTNIILVPRETNEESIHLPSASLSFEHSHIDADQSNTSTTQYCQSSTEGICKYCNSLCNTANTISNSEHEFCQNIQQFRSFLSALKQQLIDLILSLNFERKIINHNEVLLFLEKVDGALERVQNSVQFNMKKEVDDLLEEVRKRQLNAYELSTILEHLDKKNLLYPSDSPNYRSWMADPIEPEWKETSTYTVVQNKLKEPSVLNISAMDLYANYSTNDKWRRQSKSLEPKVDAIQEPLEKERGSYKFKSTSSSSADAKSSSITTDDRSYISEPILPPKCQDLWIDDRTYPFFNDRQNLLDELEKCEACKRFAVTAKQSPEKEEDFRKSIIDETKNITHSFNSISESLCTNDNFQSIDELTVGAFKDTKKHSVSMMVLLEREKISDNTITIPYAEQDPDIIKKNLEESCIYHSSKIMRMDSNESILKCVACPRKQRKANKFESFLSRSEKELTQSEIELGMPPINLKKSDSIISDVVKTFINRDVYEEKTKHPTFYSKVTDKEKEIADQGNINNSRLYIHYLEKKGYPYKSIGSQTQYGRKDQEDQTTESLSKLPKLKKKK